MFRNPWWQRSEPAPAIGSYPPGPAPIATQPVQQQNRTAQRRGTSKTSKTAQQFQGMRVGVRPPFTPSETGKPLNCANQTQPGGRVKVVCE